MATNDYNPSELDGMDDNGGPQRSIILAEPVPEPVWPQPPVWRPRQRRVLVPLMLFITTCLSTLFAGGWLDAVQVALEVGLIEGLKVGLIEGLKYAVPLMTILICHEMGHFFQARRYGVYASYPYFIPMPISPIGTFGAVIAMEPRMGDRKALFDIGITGPLAGLVPTLIFCTVGLHWSQLEPFRPQTGEIYVGAPLLFIYLENWICAPIPAGYVLHFHPMAFAGWVGLLVTSLNLIPIGQLDGGHILYALLRQKAGQVASLLLLAAAVGVALYGLWGWILMLFLLMFMGPLHSPTANDDMPLGWFRHVLGWLTLAFIFIGFTPNPLPM